jgi:branched-chain amino acid transport system ATP-binding protein
MNAPDQVLLDVEAVRVAYGGIQAVKGVSLRVEAGELVCLIGANGAGKSTLLKAITGLEPLHAGRVRLRGQDVSAWEPWARVAQGLVMVPEGRGVFARMSIQENLLMGSYLRRDAQQAADMDRVYGLFARLHERRDQLAGTLSGGEQQMLAMGRALMARPKLLLLDEPSMGLSPKMVDSIFDLIGHIHREGVAVLLVEQNANRALELAQRGYVMDSGEVTLTGAAQDLLNNPLVRAAYLGEVANDGVAPAL